ncbi:hypothetical protein QWZ16_21910 [Vibrio ostreicida]|uniref:Uncharacterized protein n=1 Tax=Vibrio ostreicida TaxID=526588 RepID=A0ABT8C0R8_9VIBR|nr:hypothetical protein [Vibrio ostreicida]MDN3612254.1 hypothetical protein [Vibrio ostreicida]
MSDLLLGAVAAFTINRMTISRDGRGTETVPRNKTRYDEATRREPTEVRRVYFCGLFGKLTPTRYF